MPRFGRVITAMVTPFDDEGAHRNDTQVRRRRNEYGADGCGLKKQPGQD